MVGTTTNRGSSKRHPQVAVVVAVSVNGIRADRRIGGKSATGLLVGKQNWVETCDGGQIGFVFPERFTTLWISRTQALRRSQPQIGPIFIVMIRPLRGLNPMLNSPALVSAELPAGA